MMDKINKHRFALGIILNSLFVIIEVIYAFRANSIALLADAVHNTSDVLGLIFSWGSYIVASRRATHKFTYGFKNATIFAAFINSIILIIAIGNLLWESILRFFAPQPVVPLIVVIIAGIGILVNGGTALLFFKDYDKDLNIHTIFLNMALDAVLSFTIVIGGLLIWWKGWYLLDPILGAVIALAVIFSFWGLFKESVQLIFQAVPSSIDMQSIIRDITKVPIIYSYHDLHVWALSTTETALSVHIILKNPADMGDITVKLTEIFKQKYNIRHCTIQVESIEHSKLCKADC